MTDTPGQCALLIIDNQLGFRHETHWGPRRSNPYYEDNVERLLGAARRAGLHVIHVRHESLQSDSALHSSAAVPKTKKPLPAVAADAKATDFEPSTMPKGDEDVIVKNVNSSFIGTRLESLLRSHSIKRLYICGLSTDHCVSTTTRMAGNLHVCDTMTEDGRMLPGRVVLIQDATACWQKPVEVGGKWDAETVHAVHVESLQEFAVILNTKQAMGEIEAINLVAQQAG